MLVSLIKKDRIYDVVLPNKVYGSYWISDVDSNGQERNIINVEESDGKWKIKSNPDSKIVNNKNEIIEEVFLQDYSFHYVSIEDDDVLALLYSCPVYDTSSVLLEVRSVHEIFIGSDANNHIVYNYPVINPRHAKLVYNNNKWEVEDLNSDFGLYVNNVRTMKSSLSNGDIVFIMGLKIIVLGDKIIVNNPYGRVSCHTSFFRASQITIPEGDMSSSKEIELYTEEDYFFRSPRFKTVIEKEVMQIDPPPGKQNMEEMPLIYQIGPMMTMGMMSMMTMYTGLSGVFSGEKELSSALPSLIVSAAMLCSMILWPILTKRYQKKQKLKKEEERQEKYGKYITERGNMIDVIIKKQRQILIENYIPLEACEDIILKHERQLWERKMDQSDFLSVRLGMGNTPVELDIRYPEEHFTMDEDNLRDILNTLVNKSKDILGVPIAFSLVEKYISAVVGKKEEIVPFVKQLILQLITFHSFEDLKLVFFVSPESEKQWDFAKLLPHVWSNDKQVRFFATTYEEMREISAYLERDLQKRVTKEGSKGDYKSYTPYYIIITDNYKESKDIEIVMDALKQKNNIGFNVMVLNGNLSSLPNECSTFISISNGHGGVFESELSSVNQKIFQVDTYDEKRLVNCCVTLANIPIKFMNEIYALPSIYTFLEMYNIGKVEQLNSLVRWKLNDSTVSLQAPVGLDSHGMPFRLDIHEKIHGPHGLIAGMTGSGKSEFIITYILSLAVNYHPDDVSFILIDYKGGGLAGAFKNDDTGVKLPHLAGTITNLDTAEMNRSLVSIQSELRRRQAIFNEAREALNEGTIDIYKYQKFYHDGLVKEPVSHLLIISDEFAELKAQQPEFMDQLISTARIGRSLGVHLILATQKPAGVVNDQIWSNSRFRICLKVQEKADSMDMIKTPDAADIKQTGRFYLQVGYNEYFALGQSAWCGAKYVPMDKVPKKIDESVKFVNNIGGTVKEAEEVKKNVAASQGEQLTNIVKYLSDLANKENISTRQLWLDKIPEIIYIDRLAKKYNYKVERGIINPIIGEFDDPFNQRQGLLTLPLTNGGNTIIYGAADSGKELVLNAVLYSTMSNHSVEEVHFYILEFGTESLRMFEKAPHVGDILYANDSDKINNLFKMLKGEIEKRKKIFADYGGDFDYYNKYSGNLIHSIVMIINNFEAFQESYNGYDDVILQLTREGYKYGIIFILTTSASNMIRYRLAQNFKQKFALQLNDDSDYSSILGNVRGKTPTKYKGRGLVVLEGLYEFQTANICEESETRNFVLKFCQEKRTHATSFAIEVPILPEVVTTDFVKQAYKGLKTVPIGVEKNSLNVSTYDLASKYTTMITSQDITIMASFIRALTLELSALNDVEFLVVDAEEMLGDFAVNNCQIVTKNVLETMTSLKEKVLGLKKVYDESNYDKNILKSYKQTVCLVIGIDKMLVKLGNENKKLFEEMMLAGKDLNHVKFLFTDSIDKFKKLEYDEWYRSTINNNQGIWIGNGITDQFSLKLTKTTRDLYEAIGETFGYKIERGIPTLIKLVEDRKGESNEE